MITQLIKSHPQGLALIEVAGRIDDENTRELNALVNEALSSGRSYLILSMSEVKYMNSAGLRVLVQLWKQVRQIGGTLAIANPSPQVQKLLELVGLDSVFDIYYDSAWSLYTPAHPDLPRQLHYFA